MTPQHPTYMSLADAKLFGDADLREPRAPKRESEASGVSSQRRWATRMRPASRARHWACPLTPHGCEGSPTLCFARSTRSLPGTYALGCSIALGPLQIGWDPCLSFARGQLGGGGPGYLLSYPLIPFSMHIRSTRYRDIAVTSVSRPSSALGFAG
jgi:hypothetical protein